MEENFESVFIKEECSNNIPLNEQREFVPTNLGEIKRETESDVPKEELVAIKNESDLVIKQEQVDYLSDEVKRAVTDAESIIISEEIDIKQENLDEDLEECGYDSNEGSGDSSKSFEGEKSLPLKSKKCYKKEYKIFEKFRQERNPSLISESLLIAYFEELSKTKVSSSLWNIYSKLKSCIKVYQNQDISKYVHLQAFLKKCSDGYEPKKSKVLEFEHINRFIEEANDDNYLAMKVALIMGYNGACRRDELTYLSVDDIEFRPDVIIVNIPKNKTRAKRQFIIAEENWVALVKKYYDLRPNHVAHKRFFLTYRFRKCVLTAIGINTMGKIPKIIADFLKLSEPERYTGHCFRRSSVLHKK